MTDDNVEAGIELLQPTDDAGRASAASTCVGALEVTFPTVVDGVDDAVGKAYGAWPERLYVLDAEGRVAYQGGYGPFDFEPSEAAAALRALLDAKR